MSRDTILPDESRKKHADNHALGCGNFLRFAKEVSPFSGKQHVWMDRPFKALDGTDHHGFSLDSLTVVVDAYASFYYGAGVRPKDAIGVYVDEGVANLIHYMALNAIGAIPAIVNGNMPVRIAAKWFQKVGAIGLFSDETRSAIKEHLEGNQMPLFCLTNAGARAVFKPAFPEIYPFKHAATDPILISHSSGTKGIPKAIEFQHQQFFYGIRYRLGLPFPKGCDRMLSALPQSHSAGIAYVTLGVLSGCHMMILSSNKADTVLPAIESFRPSMLVAFPETYVFLNDAPMGAYDLGTNRHERCVGTPLEWVEAAVLDETGQPLPSYAIGRLGVKSPTITPGYWNDTNLTRRSQLSGYFLTGDLVYRDHQGRFFHIDRVPDVIRAGDGAVCSLQTEEFLLEQFPEVAELSVVTTHGGKFTEVTAIVRLKPEAKAAETKLLKMFNEKLQAGGKVELDAVLFVKPTEIHALPTGRTSQGDHLDQDAHLANT